MVRVWRAPLHRLVLITLTFSLTACAVSPQLFAGGSPLVVALSSPRAPLLTEYRYNAAVATFIDDRAQAARLIDSARADIAATEIYWQHSAASIGESVERADLRRQIDSGQRLVNRAARELERANTTINFSKSSGEHFATRPNLATQTAVLKGIRFERAAGLTSLQQTLATSERVLVESVAAWQIEQTRLKAEEAARVEAARVAAARVGSARVGPERVEAEQAARPRTAPAAGPVRNAVAPASVSFSKSVWTVGWQNEIDACQGAVDIGAHYGVPVIAEHWSCGGSQFPREGSTITLTGTASGVFRVGQVAAVLNVATDTADNVPRGYDLMYQTCRNGSSATMTFTALTRIG